MSALFIILGMILDNKVHPNSKQGLVLISTYVLPKDTKFRNEIIDYISKKKIECHFIFENLICKNKIDFKKINFFFKLRNFTNS